MHDKCPLSSVSTSVSVLSPIVLSYCLYASAPAELTGESIWQLADGDSNDEGSSGGSNLGAAGGDVDLESSMDSTGSVLNRQLSCLLYSCVDAERL